jgi:pimeloyl-ACP methyl ester carboxylesterase
VSGLLRRAVLALCLALVAMRAWGAESSSPHPRPAVRYEPYAIVSSWGTAVVKGELGRFRVLENRTSGSTREIELAFVRIPSVAKHPGPPIVWLAGGPGQSGIADLDTPILRLFLELRAQGDILVLDQRGTGQSVPRLDCPGFFRFPFDVALDRSRAIDGLEAAARACAERWHANGVDLAAYNTRESAEDVEDLRAAVGADKVRLLAGSYGTHLALAAIRAHEDRVDRAVLIGVVGPDHLRSSPKDLDTQLSEIARLARHDPALASQVPDLLAAIRDIRDRLGAHPTAVPVETGDGGHVSVVVGRFDLEWYTRSLLSSRDSIAHLPELFAAMGAGDFTELAGVTVRWRTAAAPSALIFAMRCASGASAERTRQVEAERRVATLGDATDFAEERVCRALGVAPLPEIFRSPVRASLPTLFVSGTLDGDTPESNAAEVLRGFSNGEHLSVVGGAHSLLGFEDSASRSAITRFFEGGRLQTGRLEMAALAFERPEPRRRSPAEQLVARARSVSLTAPFLAGP